MFCDCSANHFNVEPNAHVCPVCLGLPGALPVPNKRALELLVRLGTALGCKTNRHSYFERKSYFYPDLPKGYQISQYRAPLCTRGELKISNLKSQISNVGRGKAIRINRAHMEEDTAKLKHRGSKTFIDFNRSGVPLIEIVSEADIGSAQEAKGYLKELARLIRWLDISNASMEKGTMRLEANVSIQQNSKFKIQDAKVIPIGNYKLNPRTELKNINSFRFVEKAIDFEIKRQTRILESDGKLQQETRGWDEKKGESFVQRVKEESDDYRYFSEPDIPPVVVESKNLPASEAGWKVGGKKKEMPWEAEERLLKEHKLPYQYISVLAANRGVLGFFDDCVKEAGGRINPKLIARVIVNTKFDPSGNTPQDVVNRLLKYQEDMGLDEATISIAVRKVIGDNHKAVDEFKSGKESTLQYLIGQTMKELKGKGDAKIVKRCLLKDLSS
jgi:aspartyl-tRNA(Asn)/glutamyl-tRNA(Gln) amidotransferase subunit B